MPDSDSDDRAYPERPMVGVGAVIFRDDELLLVVRGKEPRRGAWTIPGGAVELGETVREAIDREVLEETGLKIGIVGVADVVDAIMRDESGAVKYQYVLVDFATIYEDGKVTPGSDADGAEWVKITDLPSYSVNERLLRVVEDAFRLTFPERTPVTFD